MFREIPTYSDDAFYSPKPYCDFHRERIRAHSLHKEHSLEEMDWDSPRCRDIVLEEMGEIAREFNDYELGFKNQKVLKANVEREVIQLGAMVSAWAASFRDKKGDL